MSMLNSYTMTYNQIYQCFPTSNLPLLTQFLQEEEFAKMEKADILEMTVQYFRTLRKPTPVSSRRSPTTTRPVEQPHHRVQPQTTCTVPNQAVIRPVPRTAVKQAAILSCAEETRAYLSQIRPDFAERAYARLTQLTAPASTRPCRQELPQDLSMPRRFLRVDPSLTKPLTVVVPGDRITKAIWRPF